MGNMLAGRPPKHPDDRQRRNAAPGITPLPSGGYKGDIPEFPLDRPSRREVQLWSLHWRLPQAEMWAKMHVTFVVARYIRALSVIEHNESVNVATTNLHAEVRQLEDRLGLSPLSLVRLRWEIVDEQTGQAVDMKVASKAAVRRLRAIDPKATGA